MAAKTAASAAPEAVAHPRVVGGLVGIAGGVSAAGVAAQGQLSGAVHSDGVARDMSAPWARDGFGRFLRFPCMLGTDGVWFHASHALCYRAILLSCAWREFPENRVFRYRPRLTTEAEP